VDPSRYARLEDERRFLVPALPEDARSPRLIEDRYVTGTRLRLRRVTDERGTVCKLGQKVRVDEAHPSAAWHTTVYLDEVEFSVLARTESSTLAKRRWTLPGGGCADEFLGWLEGLVLVEGERPFEAPPRAVEVTDDERFSGGALAVLDKAEAASLLAEARALAT
jgi:CYTH domain-containing protein